jgi:hypothetical protein
MYQKPSLRMQRGLDFPVPDLQLLQVSPLSLVALGLLAHSGQAAI